MKRKTSIATYVWGNTWDAVWDNIQVPIIDGGYPSITDTDIVADELKREVFRPVLDTMRRSIHDLVDDCSAKILHKMNKNRARPNQ